MSGPLDGIRVIECAIWIQGPTTGFMLGDLGADVIKIEPLEGDPARGHTKIGNLDISGRNYSFEFANRNKRSVALNLKSEKGREIIYRLIDRADVFLHNLRLDVPERLGLDYRALSRRNPRLVYAQSSAWGPEGPDRGKAAFEVTAMARAGWHYYAGGPDMPPLWFISGLGDQLGGTYTVIAVLAALWERQRTGTGQMVDVSLLGSLIAGAGCAISTKLLNDVVFPRRDRSNVPNALYNMYKCADGEYIYLAMIQSDRYWHDFCKVMGICHLESDPRFASLEARRQHRVELISILDGAFAARPRAQWLKLLEEGGDFIYGSVQTVPEVVEDPQVLANEYITQYDHPGYGPSRTIGFPYKFSKTQASIRRAPPELGQHTEEVLQEIGYTWDDISRFKDDGVI
ncbi:MAG: CoA transferase [Chloroflexi bacterium]|nr:CoA transferase [Chloroflexota bacterium]